MSATVAAPLPIAPSRTLWRRHRSTSLLLLAALPAMLFLLVFYVMPVAMLLAQSFEGGTFKHHQKALTDGLYVGVLMDTFIVRGLLVPGMVLLLGRWNWWPGKLPHGSLRSGKAEDKEVIPIG